MTAIKVFIIRYSVTTYFLLTFAISWGGVFWIIGASGELLGSAATSDPRFISAFLAMLAGPSISGLLLTVIVEGRDGPSGVAVACVQVAGGRSLAGSGTVDGTTTVGCYALRSFPHLILISPGYLYVDGEGAVGAVRYRSGTGCRHLRGTGLDRLRDPADEAPLRCVCYGTHRRRSVGSMAPADERILGKSCDCRRSTAFDFPASECRRRSCRIPYGVQGVDGGALRPHWESVRGYGDARESDGQRADPRSLGISGVALLTYSFAFAGAVWGAVAVVAARHGWQFAQPPVRSVRRAA